MLTPHFYPIIAGEERQTQWEAKALIEHGQPVKVITRRYSPILPANLPVTEGIDGIPVVRIDTPGGGKMGSLRYVLGGFWHLLRYGRGGIYHARTVGAPGWMAVAARFALGGRAIIKLPSGRYSYEETYTAGFKRWQLSTLLRLANRVVVVNSEVQRYISAELGVPSDRVLRVANFVDTAFFHPVSPEEKRVKRQQLNLPADKAIVVFVGRFVPVKGLDVLLRGWAALPRETRERALLVMVGDGAEREKLTELMYSLGLHESVLMVGIQKAVRDYYWSADMSVLSSRSEGLSTALLEAMACGLPCVASRVGGAPDVIEEGKNGLLFESENHEQLAGKLAALLDAPEGWSEMGAQARETVTTYGNIEIIVTQLLDLYNQLD